MNLNKISGILLLLVFVCTSTAILNENFISPYNMQNLLRSSSMFAIIGIGAIFVIVTGGIDLSIGSTVCIVGCTMVMLINKWEDAPPEDNLAFFFWFAAADFLVLLLLWGTVPWLAQRIGIFEKKYRAKIGLGILVLACLVCGILSGQIVSGANWLASICGIEIIPIWFTFFACAMLSLLIAAHIGLAHGLLITKLNLQPFVVTLCTLLIFRGLARWPSEDSTQGFGPKFVDSFRLLADGQPCTATAVIFYAGIIALVAGLLSVVWRHVRKDGSYLFAFQLLVAGCSLVAIGGAGWISDGEDSVASDASTVGMAFSKSLMLWSAVLLLPIVVLFVHYYRQALKRPLVDSQVLADRDPRWVVRVCFHLVALLATIGIMFALKNWIGNESVSIKSGETESYVKVACVFAAMSALILSIVRLGKVLGNHLGEIGKALYRMAGFFSGLWLMGNTSLAETVVQTPFFFMAAVVVIAAVLINLTVFGRHLLAVGNNEEAAKYSGIDTDTVKIIAYVLCSMCAGIGAILFTLDSNSVQPSGFGNFFELYAIAAAVLGGCSLRGGEASVIGVVIGATILRVLYNAPDMIGIPQQLELTMIGAIILIGAIVDEVAKKIAARRKLASK